MSIKASPIIGIWAPSQYPKRRLFVRSRQVSKPRDLYLELSDRSEIWHALRQQCCRCACQISKRYDNLKYQSRGFDTSRDLTKRRLFGYWDGTQARHFSHKWFNVLLSIYGVDEAGVEYDPKVCIVELKRVIFLNHKNRRQNDRLYEKLSANKSFKESLQNKEIFVTNCLQCIWIKLYVTYECCYKIRLKYNVCTYTKLCKP